MPVFDTLQTYLLVVNLSSLLLQALHFMFQRRGVERVGEVVRSILSLAGGAAGTMLALLVWDRRTKKENAWQHVVALSSLVIWGVLCGFVYGVAFEPSTFLDKLLVRRDPLAIYLAVLSLLTLVLFGVDKRRALKGQSRIPEAVMLGLAIAGGSLGGLAGMLLFHHKVRSPQFAWGLPLVLVAQLALAAYLINAGML